MGKNILVVADDQDIKDFLSRLFYNLGHDVFLRKEEEFESFSAELWNELNLIIVDSPKDPLEFEQNMKQKAEIAKRSLVPSVILVSMPFAEKPTTEEERDFLKAELVVRQRELEAELDYDKVFLKRHFNVEKFVETVNTFLK